MLAYGIGILTLLLTLWVAARLYVSPDMAKALSVPHLKSPTLEYPLGTDPQGRNILAVMVVGVPLTLWIGFFAGAFGTVVGTILAFIAGYYRGIPDAIIRIISEAFAPSAVTGGALGALIIGFQRAAFSNEAGLGSAPIAHSAVKSNIPVTQGLVSLLEPFIDTIIICTVTALVIVVSGAYDEQSISGATGIALTSVAFEKTIPWFPYVLALAAILFAFSTMIAWSYYGLKSWTYLFGKSSLSENIFKIIFCSFVIIGSMMSLGPVLDLSDSMIFLMAIANIVGIYILAGVVKKEIDDYKSLLSSGKIKKAD